MLTLGFTNHYYTLWNVTQGIIYGRGETVNDIFMGAQWMETKYRYIQNLSMDYDEAVAKITEKAGSRGFDEDLDLKGENGSFQTTVRMRANYPINRFTFGKLEGCDINTCTDIWQIKRAMISEVKGRTRVIARQRLVELGELVRHDWIEQVWTNTGEKHEEGFVCGAVYVEKGKDIWAMVPVKRKYAFAWQVKKAEMTKKDAHYHNNGEKVILELKCVGSHSFEGSFGTTFIDHYIASNGNAYHYMGGRPPNISREDFVKVQGTVKHDSYKGVNQTKLQRIKIK